MDNIITDYPDRWFEFFKRINDHFQIFMTKFSLFVLLMTFILGINTACGKNNKLYLTSVLTVLLMLKAGKVLQPMVLIMQ